jgi:hypothetical protein
LDAFTRGEKKKNNISAHLRNQSGQINLKTGHHVKNLSTTMKKTPGHSILRNSDPPIKNFRTNLSYNDPIREMSYDNQDIDTVERPDRSISKDGRHLGIDPCINITRKENLSGERGRGRTSSNKSKRHLSTSLSKSSPVRFGSSESRRRTNDIVGPPPKVIKTRMLNEPKRINKASPVHHLRNRNPQLGKNIPSSLLSRSREDQGSSSPPSLRNPPAYRPIQAE